MDPLQAGITAARQGNRAEARAWLQEAIRRDPNNEPAWLWLSTVVESDAEHRLCLTRALAINPNNETTRARLADLAGGPVEPAPRVTIAPLVPPPGPVLALPVAPAAPAPTTSPVEPPAGAAPAAAPVTAEPRPAQSPRLPGARRLPPHLVPPDAVPPPEVPEMPASEQSTWRIALPVMVVVGCLAVTAVSGLLVLLGLLVMGWAS
jgi:hypothetical protein